MVPSTPVSGIADRGCTVPARGLVDQGEFYTFPGIFEWDVKKHPFLKHFTQSEKAATPEVPRADLLDQDILAAVQSLDPNKDEHWTEAGKPAMAAVEGIMEDDRVTRADVERLAPKYDREVAEKPEGKKSFFDWLKGKGPN